MRSNTSVLPFALTHRISEVDEYLKVTKAVSTKARSLLRFKNLIDCSPQMKVEKLQLVGKVAVTDTGERTTK